MYTVSCEVVQVLSVECGSIEEAQEIAALYLNMGGLNVKIQEAEE